MTTGDEFYIGYETPVPAGSRSRVFGSVALALAVLVATGVALVAGQSPLAKASFDYGASDAFTGVLSLDPYPALQQGRERLWLVAPGKRGAADLVRAFEGHHVRLQGALIQRGPHRMVEVVQGSVAVLSEPPGAAIPAPDIADLGEATFRGEIVDGKCYLGVMNPGEGVVHRDCARACLRGGLPAMFAVRADDGRDVLFVLVDENGGPMSTRAAPMAGRPIALTGRVFFEVSQGQWTLRLTPRASPIR